MTFEIEYEIPPLRAIYTGSIIAESQEDAVAKFIKSKPNSTIRKINGEYYEDYRPPVKPNKPMY